MSTDTPADEREMAREALGLIQRGYALAGRRNDVSLARAIEQHWSAAGFILKELGPCPGFWGEVLAAVRVLGGDAPFEPAAILAALRAVVGAADV